MEDSEVIKYNVISFPDTSGRISSQSRQLWNIMVVMEFNVVGGEMSCEGSETACCL